MSTHYEVSHKVTFPRLTSSTYSLSPPLHVICTSQSDGDFGRRVLAGRHIDSANPHVCFAHVTYVADGFLGLLIAVSLDGAVWVSSCVGLCTAIGYASANGQSSRVLSECRKRKSS